jgi:hypothetical protein
MYLSSDYVAPAELTGYARGALADLAVNAFRLSDYLPDRLIDDLDYRFYTGGEGLAEAATFRSYDAESPIGARPGIQRVSGELPPISRKIRLGEYDRLRMRNATGGILDALYSDAERMVRSVGARMELARGDALVNGRVSIAENGVQAQVDFGRTANHTVAAATVWSDTVNSKPLTDLLAWVDRYVATNGERPGRMLISSATLAYLLRNAEFRALASNVVAGTPNLVSQDAIRATLGAYGLPDFVVNDEQVRVNGAAVRVIPANRVVFLPANPDDLGATLWGTTAEALEPDFGITDGDGPGVVAGVYTTKDPVAVWTKAAAIGLPILANPDLTLSATVA